MLTITKKTLEKRLNSGNFELVEYCFGFIKLKNIHTGKIEPLIVLKTKL